MNSRTTATLLITLGLSVGWAGTTLADKKPWDDDDRGRRGRSADNLRARPFVFVGTVSNCGVAGSSIVTSAWLGGMGLPDDGTSPNSPAPGAKADPHLGLLLSKNGATPDCAAAGATIEGFRP